MNPSQRHRETKTIDLRKDVAADGLKSLQDRRRVAPRLGEYIGENFGRDARVDLAGRGCPCLCNTFDREACRDILRDRGHRVWNRGHRPSFCFILIVEVGKAVWSNNSIELGLSFSYHFRIQGSGKKDGLKSRESLLPAHVVSANACFLNQRHTYCVCSAYMHEL